MQQRHGGDVFHVPRISQQNRQTPNHQLTIALSEANSEFTIENQRLEDEV